VSVTPLRKDMTSAIRARRYRAKKKANKIKGRVTTEQAFDASRPVCRDPLAIALTAATPARR
jgi:hypothetical protein